MSQRNQTRFTATLPLAPGINSAYRAGVSSKTGRGRLYMAPTSTAWKKAAGDLLLEQGWRPLPRGKYRLSVTYTIYCIAQRDIDSVIKVLIDVATKRIGIADSHVMECHMAKVVVPKAQQRIEVVLIAEPLT